MFWVLIISYSHQGLGQNKPSIKGVLVDSTSKEPLSFASIWVEGKADKSVGKGAIATVEGTFEIGNLVPDTYLVRVEYVGYKTRTILLDLNQQLSQKDLGFVLLSPDSQLLESVEVRGVKSVAATTIEKKTFKAEEFLVAKGGTATDVLRNIPSITINAEGEISMRGSKGFLILVNGKPSQLDASTLLNQLPANTIEKIELITAPSAKYDADGKAGIINIVTKVGSTDGRSLTANLQYGLPRIDNYFNDVEPVRRGIDVAYGLRKKGFEATFSGNYLQNDLAGQRDGDVRTTINNIETSFPSFGQRSYKRTNYGFRTLLSQQFKDKSNLSAGFYRGYREQYRTANIFYSNNTKKNIETGQVLRSFKYYNPNLVLKKGDFLVSNIDFNKQFKTGASILLSALYERANLSGFTDNRNLGFSNFKDTIQATYNDGRNPLDAIRLKFDHEKTIGIGKLTSGYQFRYQIQKGGFVYSEKNGNFKPFERIEAFSAETEILNRIHGVYSQYAGVWKKTEFLAGLRYENSLREFTDNKGNVPSVLQLSNLFPSASLLYDAGKGYRLKMAYSRRVQRSTNNELNPYPEREHSETLEQGDPNIRPEFIGVYEVGVTKDSKKITAYTNLYAQRISDIVNRVNSVYNDSILNRIYTNAGRALLLGTDAGLTYSPFKQLKIFLGGNVYRLQIEGALFNNAVAVNTRGWVHSINSNVNYQFSKTLSTQFNLSYLSARKTAQGEDSRYFLPNLSVRKTFLQNKISATMQWQNIALGGMATNQQRITTFGKDFFTTTNYIQETNILMLNLSYSFNQNTKKAKLPASEFGEKEF